MSNQHTSDEHQLVEQIQKKRPDALGQLYDNYSDALYGVILRIINDESLAEEVLQDAFMKFWQKMDQYDASKGRLFTWMLNISRNLAIDKLRSKEFKKSEKTNELENYVSTIDRGHQSLQHIDGIGIGDMLNDLKQEEKVLMELVYFKGFTQMEIAEEFQIPLGTVKTRLRVAMQKLRKLLNVE